MTDDPIQNLKSYAEDLFLRSKDEVSNDREIMEKLKDKMVIIKETSSVELIFKHDSAQITVPLYLIGKLIGHKILGIIDKISADTTELSNNLHIPPKALSRPLGMLLNEGLIEKAGDGFQIRAYKILDFLDSLGEEKTPTKFRPKIRRQSKSTTKKQKTNVVKNNPGEHLKSKGLEELCGFIGLLEEKLRKILFVRENDVTLIDTKFIDSKSTKEIQLDTSLALLLLYKYVFDLDKCPSMLLRKKLQLMGIKSLVNLTTNLHKFPEYVIHDAGKVGSTDNYFLITQPGENRIKAKIKKYLGGDDNENQ
ncbi:MAG: hypothetical protein KKA62_01165 [Nanoarchaeota archaeon]|nr:hypothetical protein [Nanoarchaeota archaeon]MBU1643917.1 hypothetical protein [Nanoarchaeota archaeon]MBU1976545.1 hypothetical protein [Nanoarchaeota archaeon]